MLVWESSLHENYFNLSVLAADAEPRGSLLRRASPEGMRRRGFPYTRSTSELTAFLKALGNIPANLATGMHALSTTSKCASGPAKSQAKQEPPTDMKPSRVSIPIDDVAVDFSTVLLRDSCSCPLCVHESTQQRLFSTADVPSTILAREVAHDALSDCVVITWDNDAPGYSEGHATKLDMATLRKVSQLGWQQGLRSNLAKVRSYGAKDLWNCQITTMTSTCRTTKPHLSSSPSCIHMA